MNEPDQNADYYSILGAPENATQSEIDRHYRRKAVLHHPDVGGNEDDMKSLNEAYGVLKDSSQRRTYDDERQRASLTIEAATESVDAPTGPTPPLQVDAITHQVLASSIFLILGLVLLFIVRFQYVIFLWPLALLAVFMVLVGIVQAHSVLSTVRGHIKLTYPKFNFVLLQEAVFWLVVIAGGYGVYLLLAAD